MNLIFKITTIIILLLLITAIMFLWFIPSFKFNRKVSGAIYEGRKEKVILEEEISRLTELQDNYFLFYALFEKYNTKIPLNDSTSALIDQLYEIGKYSGAKIQFIDFKEISETDYEKNTGGQFGVLGVNIMITGSYYQIMTFLNTTEIMPRLVKIENISINLSDTTESENKKEDNPDLTALINLRTFFDNSQYVRN